MLLYFKFHEKTPKTIQCHSWKNSYYQKLFKVTSSNNAQRQPRESIAKIFSHEVKYDGKLNFISGKFLWRETHYCLQDG